MIIYAHRFPLVQSATIGGSFIYIEEWRSTLQSLKCANVIEELPAEQYDNLQTLNIETVPGISEQSIYQAFPNVTNLFRRFLSNTAEKFAARKILSK